MVIKGRHFLFVVVLIALFSSFSLASLFASAGQTYFVATNGSNNNNGTK